MALRHQRAQVLRYRAYGSSSCRAARAVHPFLGRLLGCVEYPKRGGGIGNRRKGRRALADAFVHKVPGQVFHSVRVGLIRVRVNDVLSVVDKIVVRTARTAMRAQDLDVEGPGIGSVVVVGKGRLHKADRAGGHGTSRPRGSPDT
jgi:hypothetical protein